MYTETEQSTFRNVVVNEETDRITEAVARRCSVNLFFFNFGKVHLCCSLSINVAADWEVRKNLVVITRKI